MKKLIPKALAVLASSAPLLALAQYDYEYTSDYATSTGDEAAGLAVLGGMLVVWIIAMVVLLAFFIFWIVMLVDCVKREFEQRGTWLAVLIVSFFLGFYGLAAVLYYFMVKRKNPGTKGGPKPTPDEPAQPTQPTPPAPEQK